MAQQQEGKTTPIDQNFLTRLGATVRHAFTGGFFSPGDPIRPQAQEEAYGRAKDYQVAYNVNIEPRSSDGGQIGFHTLRRMADSYDLLRLAIETKKDQIAALRWTVKPTDPKKKPDARCEELIEFFKYPDRHNDWSTWFRMVNEDMLVLDAVSLFVNKTVGGKPLGLQLVDPATIKLLIDERGLTPFPPMPAYQQEIKGIPAVHYTTEELVYSMRNMRSHKIYGHSPVEQVLMTVNIALRRQQSQLEYYTVGNIPDVMLGVPQEWNPEQIATYQLFWDEMYTGKSEERRKVKFVPGGMNAVPIRSEVVKDEFDNWLARIICYAFSIPSSALVKDQSFATAKANSENAKKEGLEPMMIWAQGLMNKIIHQHFGYSDLEFKFEEEVDTDPLKQAEINKIYLETKVKTVNEVRDELGLDPLSDEEIASMNPQPEPPGGKPGEEEEGEEGEDEQDPKPGEEEASKMEKASKKKSWGY